MIARPTSDLYNNLVYATYYYISFLSIALLSAHHISYIQLPLLVMVLAYPFLALLHAIYSLVVASISLFRHLTRPTPAALKATRRRVPKHLAILFVPDTEFDERTIEHCIIESIQKSINWCQQVGVRELSVYDAEGEIGCPIMSPLIHHSYRNHPK